MRGIAGGVRNVVDIPVQGCGVFAFGAAQMARFVWDHVKGGRDSYWLVEMDSDRRLLNSRPRFLRDEPITLKRGRVGNGLLLHVMSATRGARELGCYGVVHFCGDGPKRIDVRDRWTCDKMVNGNGCHCYMPKWLLAGMYAGEWSYQFFVDMVLLWRDGDYLSFREAGVIEMDGGDEI